MSAVRGYSRLENEVALTAGVDPKRTQPKSTKICIGAPLNLYRAR